MGQYWDWDDALSSLYVGSGLLILLFGGTSLALQSNLSYTWVSAAAWT